MFLYTTKKFKVLIAVVIMQTLLFIYPVGDFGFTKIPQEPVDYITSYLSEFPNLKLGEVLTIVHIESDFNPNLIAIEHSVNDKSYGPMQVRLKTARHSCHYAGPPKELCTWKQGLYMGMMFLSEKKYIATQSAKNPILRRERMWASYNAGNFYLVKKKGKWVYANAAYVHRCETLYAKKYKKFDDGTATKQDYLILSTALALVPQKHKNMLD